MTIPDNPNAKDFMSILTAMNDEANDYYDTCISQCGISKAG